MEKIVFRYRPDTPFYAKNLFYWGCILAAVLLDTFTLYSLFNPVLNGSSFVAYTTTAAVAIILDGYSVLLPNAVKGMHRKRQFAIFGIGLAVIIGIIFCFFLIFRVNTGDASVSTEVYVMPAKVMTILNFLLGLVPLASTAFTFYLSLIKEHWDHLNNLYSIDVYLTRISARLSELRSSNGMTLKLEELDLDGYNTVKEIVKALAQLLKIEARLEYAKSIGDQEAVTILSEEKILSEEILNGLKSKALEIDRRSSVITSNIA